MSDADDLPPLCAMCNMCCDGTLFSHARMEPGEEAQAHSVGLAVFDAEGRPAFRLPCPRVTAQGCSVYDRRPDKCRRYRCETLKALDAGDIDRREAGRRVARARETIDQITHLFELGSLAAVRRQIATSSPDWRAHPAQALALARLQLMLDRYFLRPDKRILSGPDG